MDIMIDIETLGLAADSRILQIGIATMLGDEPYQRGIKFDGGKQSARSVLPATLEWWGKQDAKVIHDVFNGQLALNTGLFMLSDIIHELTTRRGVPDEDVEFWCRGMEFDFLILEHAMEAEQVPIPWKYYQKNDLRTLSKLIPQIPVPKNPHKHNAAMDAVYQLEHLHALKRAVNESVLFVPRNAAFLPTEI